MLAFDHHADPLRAGGIHHFAGDLRREPLLNLQAPRVDIDNPRELAQSEDFFLRDIADVAAPEKREHMVLAHAVHLDVARDDHVV